jgi:TolB protein
MDINGKNARNLTTVPSAESFPTWSPDGTMIAFVSGRSGNRDLWVMNADGTEPTRLTDSPEIDTTPCWSPNPFKIVFASERGGGVSHLWVLTLEVKK